MEQLIVECPHCSASVIIEALNCRIFRHATFKSTGTQMNPHASEAECTKTISEDLIYGCGKPFRVDSNNVAVACDYI
jgi:DNA-directed RNA polymerase subunit RPC12/RpoP